MGRPSPLGVARCSLNIFNTQRRNDFYKFQARVVNKAKQFIFPKEKLTLEALIMSDGSVVSLCTYLVLTDHIHNER